MRKIFKVAMYFIAGAFVSSSLVACGSDDNIDANDQLTEKDVMFKKALVPYVDNTVIPTYRKMADHAIALSKICDEILASFDNGTITSEQIEKAGKEWKESRKYWEQSEAFLFGPANNHNIDPHIDSWPLDMNAMESLLENIRKGEEVTIENNLGYGLLGFHALEYMLFELSEDGEKSLTHNTNYTKEELVYTAMVAEDLRNQCVFLEAAWAGVENITKEKASFLEDAEIEVSLVHGDFMKNAGRVGSIYKTPQDAVETLINGCIDICDEVGSLKIGNPFKGANDDDKNFIESPYSLNSIVDFQDNIISIKNSYCGSKDGDASISDYIKSKNEKLDAEIVAKIDYAITAISKIPEPFVKHASGSESQKAMDVLEDLANVLDKAKTLLSE